jgi:hypothetical protein
MNDTWGWWWVGALVGIAIAFFVLGYVIFM